jgi:hypothetical protein
VLSPDEIAREIEHVMSDMQDATFEYKTQAEEAARCEVRYKVAFAKARLSSDRNTVNGREDEATIATQNELLARRIAEELRASQREALLTLRARLEGLRTLSASLRTQT